MTSPQKLYPPLRELLDATGLPWEIIPGRRHQKIFIAGRMVTVVSHGKSLQKGQSDLGQVKSAVRRFVQGLQCSLPKDHSQDSSATTMR